MRRVSTVSVHWSWELIRLLSCFCLVAWKLLSWSWRLLAGPWPYVLVSSLIKIQNPHHFNRIRITEICYLLTISTQSIVLVDGERLTVCTGDDLVNVWYAAISMNCTSSYSHSHLNEVLGSSAVQYFHALVALGRRPETPNSHTHLTAAFQFQLNVCLPILSLGLPEKDLSTHFTCQISLLSSTVSTHWNKLKARTPTPKNHPTGKSFLHPLTLKLNSRFSDTNISWHTA